MRQSTCTIEQACISTYFFPANLHFCFSMWGCIVHAFPDLNNLEFPFSTLEILKGKLGAKIWLAADGMKHFGLCREDAMSEKPPQPLWNEHMGRFQVGGFSSTNCLLH